MKSLGIDYLVQKAKSLGCDVKWEKSDGLGLGWYAYKKHTFIGFFKSEYDAWYAVFERIVLLKPGETVFTSEEYYKYTLPGSAKYAGKAKQTRDRLEVRKIENHYEVFLMKRLYAGDLSKGDVFQERLRDKNQHSIIFNSQSEAIAMVDKFIAGFKGAELEHFEDVQGAYRPEKVVSQ